MKRYLSILVLFTMLLAILCPTLAFASGAQQAAGDPITFDVFIPYPDAKIPPDDAPVMQQVFEKTGVRFKRLIPPAEPAERLNLMLASDDMPDLILFESSAEGAALMKQYIAAGKLLKLNDLLEQFAPNTFNVNWAMDVKGKIADENGDFWFLPPGYSFGTVEVEANDAFNIRTDYFDEKGWTVPTTLEEYAQLLRDVKAWNPGISPLGLALGPQGHIDRLVMIGAATNGLNYDGASCMLDPQKDELIYYTQSPQMKAFFKFLNQLNIEGLIDPESPIMSAEMLKQKAVAEQVWSFIGPWWEINSEVNAYEKSIGSTEQSVYLFPVADKSVKVGTYAPYSINMYSAGLTLTHKMKDPERFMKFYEYANTEEGWLAINGIINFDFTGDNTVEATEGYDYIIRQDKLIDGKPNFEASAWMGAMWGNDENWYWNRGVESMGMFTYNLSQNHPNTQLSRAPVDVGVWWDEESTRTNNLLGWTGTTYLSKMAEMGVDNSAFAGLTIDPSSPEYPQWLAIRKLHEDTLPRVIMAPDAQAFETEWTNYVAELEKQGLAAVMAKYNQMYHTRMEKWAVSK